MIDLATTITAINPNAKVTIYDEDIDTIDWGETTPISNEDILSKQAELQADYESKEYQRKRKIEYPSIAEQLDDIYHNGIDSWKANIQIIKDKYPKE